MTWEYSGDPADSAKDAVRYLIGDTDSGDPFVQDEEIDWALTQNGNDIYKTASFVAKTLSAKFSTLADEEIGPLKFKYADRAKSYEKIASRFESDTNNTQALTGIFCGGNSVSEKLSTTSDTDAVQPYFYRNQFDIQAEETPEIE